MYCPFQRGLDMRVLILGELSASGSGTAAQPAPPRVTVQSDIPGGYWSCCYAPPHYPDCVHLTSLVARHGTHEPVGSQGSSVRTASGLPRFRRDSDPGPQGVAPSRRTEQRWLRNAEVLRGAQAQAAHPSNDQPPAESVAGTEYDEHSSGAYAASQSEPESVARSDASGKSRRGVPHREIIRPGLRTGHLLIGRSRGIRHESTPRGGGGETSSMFIVRPWLFCARPLTWMQ